MSGAGGGAAGGAALVVDVMGTPRPQPRPRVLKSGRTVSTTGKAAVWKRQVLAGIRDAIEATGWQMLAGPAGVRLVTRFGTRDESRWWRPVCIRGKGDADNLAKVWMDAMSVRRVWGDDCQVCALEARQVWVPPECAGAVCEVWAVDDGRLEWARAAWGGSGAGVVPGDGLVGAPGWIAGT